MNIEVFDNLLDQKEQDHIENFLRDPKFPWFLSVGVNHYTVDKETYDNNKSDYRDECILLTHTFYLNSSRNSDNYQLSDFILNRFLNRTNINFTNLFRTKANLQLPYYTDKLHTTPHIDNNNDHKVLIYYANNCDGDTFFLDSQHNIINQINPIKGRFILFDGKILHAAGFSKSQMRINVNFNFI